MKKKNTYNPAEITENGANKHLSGLHNSCIRTNQYVWDLMKVLDKEEMYGFHFEAKVGGKKILVTLHHEKEEELKKAQRLLRHIDRDKNVIFLTKLKEKKKMDKRWLFFYFFIFLAFVSIVLFDSLAKNVSFNEFFSTNRGESQHHQEANSDKKIIVEEVEVDIAKLKALKESFDEQNSTTLSPKVMKALTITTEIISETVSEEEKAKYSAEALVKSFKGKSGFKLVVKEDKNNKDFNKTVEELNDYALHFVKENNLSEAIKYYDKVSQEKNASKQEKLIASCHQGEIFEKMGLNEEAKKAYTNALKHDNSGDEKNTTVATLNRLVTLGNLAKLHDELNEKKEAKVYFDEAEKIYDLLIVELEKYGEIKQEELALALNYLANFYGDNQQHLLAIKMRRKSIAIYEALLKKEHKKFGLTYYKTVNALGNSYLAVDHAELAQREYENALYFMQKLVKQKVVKNREYIALSYRALGKISITNEKFKEAKKYYTKALNIYHLLEKKEKRYHRNAIKMHGEFATLYALEKKFELAEQEYNKGIEALMKMPKKIAYQENLEIANLLNNLVGMKLNNEDLNTTEILKLKKPLNKAKQLAVEVLKINFKEAKKSLARSYAYLAYIEGLQHNLILARTFYLNASLFQNLKGVKGLK